VTPNNSSRGLEKTTLSLGQCPLPTKHGEFVVHFFRDLARDRIAMAIVRGDLSGRSPLLVRVHSSCLTSECLSGLDCDCAEQLEGALAMMAREGEGILFYLMQEGRGAGLTAKARDRMIVQASGNQKTTFEAYAEMGLPGDLRRYDVLAPMSRLLGLRAPVRLLTNNPDKAAAVTKAFAEEGIDVCRMERIVGPTSPFNRDYLVAKHDSGHAYTRPSSMLAAKPPVDVRVIAPFVLPGEGHRVLTASYYLPIALSVASGSDPDVEWFRVSVVFDGERAQEWVLISHRNSSEVGVEVKIDGEEEDEAGEARTHAVVITMSLLDRLPSRSAVGRLALREALLDIRRAGQGAVTVCFDDRHCANEGLIAAIDSGDRPKHPPTARTREGSGPRAKR